MKVITDKILKSDFVNWRDLEIIQPKGFKELSKPAYQKLRNSIIENNFVESFKVWDNGKTYLLDGVHRCKVLDILDSEGYDIPDKFRADFIECKDKKQAKKMILVYSSRYAKLLEDGLYEFVQDLDWDAIEKITDYPDINLDVFELRFQGDVVDNPLGEWGGMPEFTEEDQSSFQKISVHFKTQSDVDKFSKLIKQKLTEKTRAIWFPLVEIAHTIKNNRYSDES